MELPDAVLGAIFGISVLLGAGWTLFIIKWYSERKERLSLQSDLTRVHKTLKAKEANLDTKVAELKAKEQELQHIQDLVKSTYGEITTLDKQLESTQSISELKDNEVKGLQSEISMLRAKATEEEIRHKKAVVKFAEDIGRLWEQLSKAAEQIETLKKSKGSGLRYCHDCGQLLSFVEAYQKWFCSKCREYQE